MKVREKVFYLFFLSLNVLFSLSASTVFEVVRVFNNDIEKGHRSNIIAMLEAIIKSDSSVQHQARAVQVMDLMRIFKSSAEADGEVFDYLQTAVLANIKLIYHKYLNKRSRYHVYRMIEGLGEEKDVIDQLKKFTDLLYQQKNLLKRG